MKKEYSYCKKQIKNLLDYLKCKGFLENEAQTRFHIIDKLIEQCLGWDKEEINIEQAYGRSFTDYELGVPRLIIWEAKKEGVTFELPPNPSKNHLVDIGALMDFSDELKNAFTQAQRYCIERGVQIAVASNGRQIVAFLATRTDGISPFEGKALTFSSLEDIEENFNLFWEHLSDDGVKERRIVRYLTSGEIGMPRKLSSKLTNYPRIRYASDTQASLKQLSELLIQDIIESKDIEESFFRNCYCESGTLSRFSLLSKHILEARYACLFDESEPYPKVSPVKASKKRDLFTPSVITEALSKRPIVLIGDVGVGKTSFVKHLMYISAHEEFSKAIYIYIDLGSTAALSASLKDFVLGEMERQLSEKYGIDINNDSFVKGVYSRDIRRFARGIYSQLKNIDKQKYEIKKIEMLGEKTCKKDQHIKLSINHISFQEKRQIIFSLDNSDQRDYEVQQEAFIISQELAKEWSAAVFISVRPQTFYKSKRSGALTAYPNKIFSILPPRIDSVINKRLEFALKMAKGEIPIERFKNVTIEVESLSLFLISLIHSLRINREIDELLQNITGGNVRSAIDLVKGFIGSPNVDAEKIINIMQKSGEYLIPLHEFSKSALLGDFSHYNPEASIAMNMYDVFYPDTKEHFLASIILAFMSAKGPHKDKNGFVLSQDVIQELQDLGYLSDSIERSLRRMSNKKLIETSQRITFEEDEASLIGDMPNSFRVNDVGLYHLNRWMTTFAYYDAMVFDTPIFNKNLELQLFDDLESFDIEKRYNRALSFRQYLQSCWVDMPSKPHYFDYTQYISSHQNTFDRVKAVIVKK